MIVYVSDNDECYLSLYLIWNTEQNTFFFVNNQTVGLAPKLSWRTLYKNHKNKMADAKEEHTLSSAFFFKSTCTVPNFPTTHFRTSRGAHCFRLGRNSLPTRERASCIPQANDGFNLLLVLVRPARLLYFDAVLLLRTNRHHLDGDRASPDYV